MFKRIREITGKMVSRPSACIKSSTGELLYEPEDAARRWSEYLGQLFNDFRTNEEFISLNALSGPPITKDEIRWALHKSKTNKAAGPDEVVTEMLKALGDTGVNILHSLVNKIYDSGEIPNDMLKSVSIALPNKPNTLDCDQHRTISLMQSHSEAAAQDRTRTLPIQDSSGNRPVSVRLHARQRNEKCHFHSADA